MAKELCAPKGKFMVVKRIEDLDLLTPTPDSIVKAGSRKEKGRAINLAKKFYRPGSVHTSVLNDRGKVVYASA